MKVLKKKVVKHNMLTHYPANFVSSEVDVPQFGKQYCLLSRCFFSCHWDL